MNKIVTFCDSAYFTYGRFFIRTRHKVDAEVVLYAPDLTKRQIAMLRRHNIIHKTISGKLFKTKMQFLKFKLLIDEMGDYNHGAGMTFMDFDTFIVNDWARIFEDDFSLGVTVRNKQKMARAYANGGVIFCKNTTKSREMCQYAIEVMEGGGDKKLPEYDAIYKTLEIGRPAHKTWKRENLYWWVDQVFLSSLIKRYYKLSRRHTISDRVFYDYHKHKIGIFNCTKYNRLDPRMSDYNKILKGRKTHIVHLKLKGRDNLKKLDKIIKKQA